MANPLSSGINHWLDAPGDGEARLRQLTIAALVGGAAATGAIIWFMTGELGLAAGFAAMLVAAGVLFFLFRIYYPQDKDEEFSTPDWSVTNGLAEILDEAVAITDRAGRLVCANRRYSSLFGQPEAPGRIQLANGGMEIVADASRRAWRDGEAEAEGIVVEGKRLKAHVRRAGRAMDYLIWSFAGVARSDLAEDAQGFVAGMAGRMLGEVGVMLVLTGPDGRLRAVNSAFAIRATGKEGLNIVGRDFVSFLRSDERNSIFFEREGRSGAAVRLIHLPLVEPGATGPAADPSQRPAVIALIDQQDGMVDRGATQDRIEAMLGLLPLGLAVCDRDGRFRFANQSFCRVVGLEPDILPPYPADLVIKEDKAPLSDAIRRYGTGAAMSGDLAVRLRNQPDEPVSISLVGVRGLGEAAVLLSLRDNGEEAQLKREVAQATKMQAVGQLAGGVAHDFNNILTAILGVCDLMLMRHTPGDSDYDDIQQIRSNSNRAAALTRQLLAFSRQQTLRPEVLQLPDIVSDITSMLNRIIGEKVKLEVTHERGIGPVRADPAQLEQVIVNLAVNARDAMTSSKAGKGTLTIGTKRVTAADVRAMNSDILPVADYSALVVQDEGTGIPPEILGKIFEPFFTTKSKHSGTGLGLSTVYGIVKQSGGYIFAESEAGKGTRFTVYLPVHDVRADPAQLEQGRPPAKKTEKKQGWGSGRLLVVEDEDMVRAVAERALTRQGYKVVTASDGEEGLERLREAPPGHFDLILSDVVMPVMDGPAMAREVRKAHSTLPILFMSGYAEAQLRQAIDVPHMHFIAKPFSVQQIADAVGSALNMEKTRKRN